MTRLIWRKARRRRGRKLHDITEGTSKMDSETCEIFPASGVAATTSTNYGIDDAQPSTRGQPKRYNHQIPSGSTERFSHLESDLMHEAASKGDWQAAEMLLWINPELASARITSEGDIPLHIAVAHKHVKFVKELVKKMEPSDLLLQNQKGYTAFFSSAALGIVDMASAMIDKDRSLLDICSTDGMTPIRIAVVHGHRDMVLYLLRYTDPKKFPREELHKLLLNATRYSMYGSTKEFTEEINLMHQAASKGDWQTAELLLGLHPNLASAQITSEGDTALHVAVAYKHVEFVQELVKWMPPRDLELQNQNGYTAFFSAAASGVKDMAPVMIAKNGKLLTVRSRDGMTPLGIAILHGNEDMVSYLLGCTIDSENFPREELFKLLIDAIRNSMYDVALKILERNPSLATRANENGTALHLLTQEDISVDTSAWQEAILETFVTVFAALRCLSRLKTMFEKPLMRKKARSLAEKLWDQIQRLEIAEVLKLMNNPPITFEAAKVGNAKLISMLMRTHPGLIWHTDSNNYTIFHIAVLERQESIFALIDQLEVVKHVIASSYDKEGNNILHLAGKRATSRRRIIVSGAALQMQRELMWFKELEKILPPSCCKVKNNAGLQPRELFSNEHQILLKEGETWLRETADSCMLIATIMLTVVFAAAFTVPGGNNSEIGIPILLKRNWFKVFVAADAIAMFCATFSIIMFLSILTSRFREEDFLVSLPRKLVFGILGLFGSLVGAISAFTSSSILLLNVERAWLPGVLGSFACVFLTMVFLLQHIGLISEVIYSTYRPMYLFRSGRHRLN